MDKNTRGITVQLFLSHFMARGAAVKSSHPAISPYSSVGMKI
jgi:hypothetical protein